MKRVTVTSSKTGRTVEASPAQARALKARGWVELATGGVVDPADMPDVDTLIDPHESVLAADDEGDTERYERIAPRFDFETDI